jgi:hypothetical protein
MLNNAVSSGRLENWDWSIGTLIRTADLAQLRGPESSAILGRKRQRKFIGEPLVAEKIDPAIRVRDRVAHE